ncbi:MULTISPECIES: replicative DNA helicase [Aeromonas]|uniref:replicative DNA helicase n=1 Tax=Aeromonas TaxID=642 RepID=UPI000C28D378|nr:DnaB-like helicase C-terminal domain-containing protein [Aeromonas veronii]ATY78795.1 helicase DnaB [Aeromonas veronii]
MTSSILGLVPPHNFEAEQSTLGGLMIRAEAFHELSLSERDFYSRPHQIIFDAISQLVATRQPVDLNTVSHRLDESGLIEEAGGLAYLIEVIKNTPSAANITTYGAIVRQNADRRFAVARLQDCIGAMMDPGFSSTEERFATMDGLLGEIDSKRSDGVSALASPASDIVRQWCDEMERRSNLNPNEMIGYATGIDSLDKLLYPSGINKTALVCIGARPKMGKSTVMASLCNHTALVKKLPVVGFSLEMTSVELFEVMIAQAVGINRQELSHAKDQQSIDKAYSVAAELGYSKLHLADQSGMSLSQIVRECRRLRRKLGQLGLIAVDYLTLMKADKAERNDLAYGAITKGLKELAKEMGCPVVLLTQLNRGLESRDNKRPMPSDSRDTGQIEQDCDIWIGLYRDEVYDENSPRQGLLELSVRLNRSGNTGTAYCRFQEGVISNISAEEVDRVVQVAVASAKGKVHKGGWSD